MSLRIRNVIEKIEEKKIDFGEVFYTLSLVIIIRTSLEFLLEPSKSITLHNEFYLSLVDYIHVYISWLTLFLCMLLIVTFYSGKKISETIKPVLIFFPVICIVPIIDGIRNSEVTITYKNSFETFWHTFINLFNPTVGIEHISVGVRVEVFLVLIFTAIYIKNSGKNIIRAILGGINVYFIIFVFGYFPAIWSKVRNIEFTNFSKNSILNVQYSTNFNALMYLPLLLLVLLVIYYLLDKKWREILKVTIRFERMSIYLGVFLLSLSLGVRNALIGKEIFNSYDILKILSAILTISLLFIYSVITNDINDRVCDEISNKNRPLVRYNNIEKSFIGLKNASLILGLLFSILVNEHYFFTSIALVSFSNIYSNNPLRLKKYCGIGHTVISLIAGAVVLMGNVVIDANLAYQNLDKKFILSIMIFIFISSHYKDLKDISGDKKDGVSTMGTIFGEKIANQILKILIPLVLFFVGVYLKLNLVYIFLIVPLLALILVFTKKSEKAMIFLQGICFISLSYYVFYIN